MTQPRVIRNYDDLADYIKSRKEELGLSNEFMDAKCVMVPGHTDKVLGPSRKKNMGRQTVDKYFKMLAFQLVPQPDLEREALMRPVWEGREDRNVRLYTRRMSKDALERAKPLVLRELGRNAGRKRAANLTASERSAIARKGGLASARARRQRLKDALGEQPIRRAP